MPKRRLYRVKNWLGGLCLAAVSLAGLSARGAEENDASPVIRGEVEYEPPADESSVPETLRLQKNTFAYEQRILGELSKDLQKSIVTFPSPVETPHERNNKVHCEYYRPLGRDKSPGVIVLHILGGDFELSRLCCRAFALRGAAALFVKMPYYGPRREPGNSRRMISKDPRQTIEGMQQAVLDIRRATAWLASREEIDADQLGVFGISLGGITGALAATAEPRLKNVCLLLAGGDISRVVWESPEVAEVRDFWLAQGGTREEFVKLIRQVDPVTFGDNVRGRRILMLNAKDDEIIPRACTESLWKAFGEPEIVWYSGGHYSVIRHFFSMLERSSAFFEPKE